MVQKAGRRVAMGVVVVLCAVSAGCSDGRSATSGTARAAGAKPVTSTSPPGTSTTAPARSTAATVDDQFDLPAEEPVGVAALRNADGTLPTAVLVSWFAREFGPVSGVTPLDADAAEGGDRSELLQSLMPRVDDLPKDIKDKLGTILFPAAARTLHFAPTRRQSDLTQAQGEQLVREGRAVLERWLGEPIGLSLRVTVHSSPDVFDGPMVGAMATVDYVSGRIVGPCTIHVRSVGGPVTGIDQWRKSAVIHELYHCYQYQLVNDAARTAATPPWVGEGTAAFVGERLSGGSIYSDRWMRTWLDQANGELSHRKYDAIGLMWLVDETGQPTKLRFDQVLTSRSDTNSRLNTLMGADPRVADDIRSQWGSHVANQTWSARWHPAAATHAPGGVQAPAVRFTYPDDGRVAILRSRGTKAGTFTATTTTDLITITADSGAHGAIHLGDGRDVDLAGGAHRFCLTAEACSACPDTGSDPLGAPATRAAGGALVIGVMSQGEGTVSVSGRKWADVCGDDPSSSPAPVDASKCETRIPKAVFRRLTGENYSNAFEDSVDQCKYEDDNTSLIAEVEAQRVENTAKAVASLRDLFVTGPDGGFREIRSGWGFAAISPDGRQLVGVHNGKQFFAKARIAGVSSNELQALVRQYLTTF